MYVSYINNVLWVLRDKFAWKWFIEGSILQVMAALLKLLPMDLTKHFCTYYSYCVNLFQDYVFLLYPRLKTVNNDT